MERIVTPRLVYKKPRLVSLRKIPAMSGLEEFFATSFTKKYLYLVEYEVDFKGLIVQDMRVNRLILLKPGSMLRVRDPEETVQKCRWHNGPLHKLDDPMQRRYCVRLSVSRVHGYCVEHSSSLRALYDKCFTGAGHYSLEACRKLDESLGTRVVYAVYLLDYGSDKFKIGSTRIFRFIERIAEQPHLAATIVYTSTSASKAREMEMSLGKLRWFSEKPRHNRLASVLKGSIIDGARRVFALVEEISRKTGMKPPPISSIITVRQPKKEVSVATCVESIEKIVDATLRLVGYWGGMLFLSDDDKTYCVRESQLIHRDSIIALVKDV